MNPIPLHLYRDWRLQNLTALSLRDATDVSIPSEKLLQAVWRHQRLLREQLRTLDGQSIRILHPGFHNREAGPDFRGAVIQFAGQSAVVGDVEVDLEPSCWQTHHHDHNRAYDAVRLHVVWSAPGKTPSKLPVLTLKPYLDAPLTELFQWLDQNAGGSWPPELAGHCQSAFQRTPEPALHEVLHQAALVRLQAKASRLQARARQAGWEQAFWEALFGALGYKHNSWAMQRLAELLPLIRTPAHTDLWGAQAWQARLFGVGGLLPGEAPTGMPSRDRYVKTLWDYWWRDRDRLMDLTLPRELWRFHGQRPANHPQRRLALAGHWLAQADLPGKLERWSTAETRDDELLPSLARALQTDVDDFWSWHCTFNSMRSHNPCPLLGAARVTDLAVNVVLPWIWLRADLSQNEALRQTAQHRYWVWPAAEDNAVLRLARHRLLGGIGHSRFPTAALQQGLLQIVRDFCDRSTAVCTDCRLPQLLEGVVPTA